MASLRKKSLDLEERRHFVRSLAHQWVKLEWLAGYMTYTEYMDSATGLQAVTHDLEQTKFTVASVFQQAGALGRSPAWLKAELRFEIIAAATGDRGQLLSLAVATQHASDESLDLYNERVNRLTTNG